MTDPFATATAAIYRALGREAMYGETPCLAIVSHDLTQWGGEIQLQADSALVSVRRSEIAERPRRGDSVAMATGQEYRIERLLLADDHEWRCLAREVIDG